MTVDNPRVMLDILAEDAAMRVYIYRHAQTGAVLYALFPDGQVDDMAWAPEGKEPVLLYASGQWTGAGVHWLLHQRSLLS